MSKQQQSNEVVSMIYGGLTAAGIGSILFQVLGVFVLGIIGALGGWVFEHFLKPKLTKYFKKK